MLGMKRSYESSAELSPLFKPEEYSDRKSNLINLRKMKPKRYLSACTSSQESSLQIGKIKKNKNMEI